MKAVIVDGFGGPEVLRLAELPDPQAGPGEVRIAVHAAGVNLVDAGNRADGSWAGLADGCVLGYDVAGVIDQVGPGVDGFRAGDRVMAMTPFPSGGGGYAELATVRADLVAAIPEGVSFVEAAAVPLAGGTAYEVLRRLDLPPGATILVHGASGGVGTFLLQLAAEAGLRVIAVGSEPSHRLLTELGALHCVDYRTTDVASQVAEPVDAIVDLFGGTVMNDSLSAVRPHGQLASIETPSLDLDAVIDANLTFHGVLIQDDGARTRTLAGLLGRTLQPVVAGTLPLDQVAEAHRLVESRHSHGKIVLVVR
ncbi:zinc-binding alcohol dehydrogenase family protein [Nonomuraea sp. NPDC050536]|uniref:zinc-binding alcohol dehydrogenase family protein n=1 Tax=Nonomuraea sp. NPDC050536 TaxID=3364366 RepID=UPI0037CA9CFE